MAITKRKFNTVIANAWTEVGDILRTSLVTNLGIATSVTAATDGSTTLEGIVVTASGIEVKIGLNGGNGHYEIGVTENGQTATWYVGNSNDYILRTAITTSNGVLLEFISGSSGLYAFAIFTKTNTNRLCVIASGLFNPYSVYNTTETFSFMAWEAAAGDSFVPTDYTTVSTIMNQTLRVMMNQTSLVPFTFWPEEGETSYAPAALYAVRPTDFGGTYSDRIMGTYHYISNGLIWLKDDPV